MPSIPAPGSKAPAFSLTDGRSKPVSLELLQGKKAVLVFLRHLGCPVCRFELSEWTRRAGEFKAAGAEVIVFVESGDASVAEFAHRKEVDFHLVGDAQRKAYKAYGVARGGLMAYVGPGAAKKALAVTLKGHMHGKFEGHELQLPADFVLDEKGTVIFSHLGAHIGDNTAIDTLLSVVKSGKAPPEAPSSSRRGFLVGAGVAAVTVAGAGGGAAYYNRAVDAVLSFPPADIEKLYQGRSNRLFDLYPGLRGKLAWLSLDIPITPATEMAGDHGGPGKLYIKRDDLTSPLYGGNKVRKLEHILAEAALDKRKTLLTVGGIGSNQCLATSLHGREHGFQVDICLFDQPVTEHVKENLLGDSAAGANIVYGGGFVNLAVQSTRRYVSRSKAGESPYYIPAGATTPLGTVGYVTAALELADQIRAGVLPEPDKIFVAAGTSGTAGGLIAGLKLAGLKSKVVAVQITEAVVSNTWNIRRVAQETADLLHRLDGSVPKLNITVDDFIFEADFFGGAYGKTTPESEAACRWAEPAIHLETTYTGKAMAACLAHCRAASAHEVYLFWNTFNSADFPKGTPESLPAALQPIFRS